MASLGFLFALSPNVRLETDVNWTGWSTFDELVIDFATAPLLNQTLRQDWEDVYNYRVGLSWDSGSNRQWRFGYVFDETPQPDETVSPLLPGSDRNGFTIGYGREGARTDFDVAFMYLAFDDRTTIVQENNFDGTYVTDALLLGLTLGF
jgi:long-chain fatty acid transport protein